MRKKKVKTHQQDPDTENCPGCFECRPDLYQQAKSSPLPWISSYRAVVREGIAKPLAVCQKPEDAALIVKTVNAHKKLVLALKWALNRHMTGNINRICNCEEWRNVREALKLAGEEI